MQAGQLQPLEGRLRKYSNDKLRDDEALVIGESK